MIHHHQNPVIDRLDFASVNTICKGSKQVVVYGYGYCGYGGLLKKMNEPGSPIEKILDCSLGNNDAKFKTLEGRVITPINAGIDKLPDTIEGNVKLCSRMCKAGLTNIVVENYKRKAEGLTLIPIIFCIDVEGASDKDVPFDPTRFASKDERVNHLLTNQEIRRAYKLCCHAPNSKFQEVAKETFKWTKLVKIGHNSYTLIETLPFWERDPGFNSAWEKRIKGSTTKKDNPKWKKEVNRAISVYEKTNTQRSKSLCVNFI